MLPEFVSVRNGVEKTLLIPCRYTTVRSMWEENSKVTRQGPLRGEMPTCKSRWRKELRLRPAKLGDYFFALSLYLEGAEKHLSKIGQWNRPRIVSKFRSGYKLAPVLIICMGEKAIGWIQVAEFVEHLHLRQIHLTRKFRGQGIGTHLITELLRCADALGKPVTLDVMHGNPARFLYLRLGFRQKGQNAATRQMIWRPPRG